MSYDLPVNSGRARHNLGGDRPCRSCDGLGNPDCEERRGPGLVATSWSRNNMSALKEAMGIKSRNFCCARRAEVHPQQTMSTNRLRPACVGMEAAAEIFGWPDYYLPFLMRAGHLKPLGKPPQNARKWFSTVEIERACADPVWLDKAIRIVEKQVQEMNRKQRSKGEETAITS